MHAAFLSDFCNTTASHTSEEVRAILATLEQEYRPLLPQLNPAINGQAASLPG